MISRQAAIDLVDRWFKKIELNGDICLDGLRTLPSVQPDIIHCKDCKHRDPEDKKCDCGNGIMWQLPRRDDWYCADAERRMPT